MNKRRFGGGVSKGVYFSWRTALSHGALLVCLAGQSSAFATSVPAQHPRILSLEMGRISAQLAAPTVAAARFRTMVDNQIDGADYWGYEPWFAALLGSATGDDLYCRHAVAATDDFVAQEEARIGTGQVPVVAGDSYLDVGAYVGGLAMVYDWCHVGLTSSQRSRWVAYANQAVWNVWHPADASWGGHAHPWSGWSIDNPVNNYHFSFLRATALLGIATAGENPQAQTWLDWFREVKIPVLASTFDRDLVGGGSREGTGYGTAMNSLFFLYYLWERSTGERIADLSGHGYASLPHFLHAMMPGLDRFAPIGDQSRDSTASLFDYQRAYVLALATLYRGDAFALTRLGRAQMARSSVPEMANGFQFVYDLLYDVADSGIVPELNTAYWAPGTGFLFQRSSWGDDATWLAHIAGPYTESHGHADGLSFMLYKEGWLVSDENIDSHSGLRQEQGAHALVTIRPQGSIDPLPMVQGGSGEGGSAHLTAFAQRPGYSYSAADAGTLFGDPSPVQSQREMVFIPPSLLVTHDRVGLSNGAMATATYLLPTPYLPTVSGRQAQWHNGRHKLKVQAVFPLEATLSSKTMLSTTRSPDGGYYPDYLAGYRLDIAVTAPGESRFLTVLAIDDAVTRIEAGSDERSVRMDLADGRRVQLGFATAGRGGQVRIETSGGVVIVDEPLPTGIQVLPLVAGPIPPGPPLAVKAYPRRTAVRLQFAPPADGGSAPVSGYTAVCRGGGQQLEASAAGAPIEVSGLTPGTRYDCTVRANSAVGAGSESPALSVLAAARGSIVPLLLLLGDSASLPP